MGENWHEERDRLVKLLAAIQRGDVTHVDQTNTTELQATNPVNVAALEARLNTLNARLSGDSSGSAYCPQPLPDPSQRRGNNLKDSHRFMAKEELLLIEGVVDEILPDGRFGVRLENDVRIIAYTAGKMRRYRIRSIVGDRVHVEMTPYDLSKGRIVYREKIAGYAGPKRRSFRR